MTTLLLKGGRVLDPSQNLDKVCDVLIEDGRIAEIGDDLSVLNADRLVMLSSGHWVCPGFVDMHVHLREPGQSHKETIRSGTLAALHGGFTTVACMPNTTPALDSVMTLDWLNQKIADDAVVNVLPVAAATVGLKGEQMTEMARLIDKGAVAFSDDGACVMNAQLMRLIMETCAALDVPFLCHAEDTNLSNCGCMNEGATSARLGLAGIPNVSESVIVARDIELARLTGAHVHFCHISARESLALIRAAKTEGLRITAEVTPHHLTHVDHAAMSFDGNLKMNPPLRSDDDRLALIEALADGTIDVIATDHAPHHPGEKERPFAECPFGVIGLETAVGVTLTALVHSGKISPLAWVKAMSTSAAKILQLPAGTLTVGSLADIAVIDPELDWTVDAKAFQSLSQNSPYIGSQLTGKPVMVLVKGQLTYQDALATQPIS